MHLREWIASFTRTSHPLRRLSLLGLVVILAASLYTVRPAHATVVYRASSVADNGAGSTTLSFSPPTGSVQNDVLVALVSTRAGGSTITPPTGWTALTSATSTTTITSQVFWAKYSTADTTYSFTFGTSGKAAGIILGYSGVSTANAINANNSQANAASTTMTAPSITTTMASTMLVGMYATANTTTSFTAGTGFAVRGNTTSSGGGSANTKISVAAQDAAQAAIASTGTKTMTAGVSAINTGSLIALTPAPIVSQASYRWFQNTDSTSAGTPYVASNTSTTMGKDTPFRLRLNIGAGSNGGTIPAATTYKLQYATRGSDGVCDSSFTNETYNDITWGTEVAFYDNPTPADGAAYVSSANDPTRSGVTAVGQKYNETNPLTVGTAITAGQDGLWDVALTEPKLNKTWVQRTVSNPQAWGPVFSSSDGVKIALAPSSGYIFTSSDSGANWTQQTSSGSHGWTAMTGSSDGTKIVAVVNGGQAYYSSNSGVTWAVLSGSPSVYWYGVASSSDGTKLVGVTANGVYTSSDSGTTWVQRTATVAQSVASSTDGTKLVMAVNGGGIYTSTDSGVTWTLQSNAGSRAWSSIASSANGVNLVATVNAGSVYTSSDSGVTWVQQTGAGTQAWASSTISADGTKVAIGVNGGYVYSSTDSGATWSRQTDLGSKKWLYLASSSDGINIMASDGTSGSGFLFTLAQTTNSTSSTYCLRAISSAGTVLDAYSVIPQLDPVPVSFTQANYRWFANANSLAPGAPAVAQDTAASVVWGTPVRLRQRIAIDGAPFGQSGGNLKLQYAEKSGTCDVAFSGETYADVATSTANTPAKLGSSAVDTGSNGTPWSSGVATLNATDGTYSGTSSGALPSITNDAILTGYGFSVPANVTITGIGISVPYQVTKNGISSPSLNITPVLNSTDNGTKQTVVYSATGNGTTIVGGATSTLGVTTLTPSVVNDPNFGFRVSVLADTDPTGSDVTSIYLDSLSVTVYYTASNPIKYYDNSAPADGSTISSVVGDPANSSRPVVYQNYLESSPFSNTVASIPTGSDGLWDFSLASDQSAGGKTYCFRVVKSDGSLLNSYSQVPELSITSASTGPTLDQQLRGGQSYVSGAKRGFTW